MKRKWIYRLGSWTLGACMTLLHGGALADRGPEALSTATPIKHLVILYLENTSFDAYFATYPLALNPPGSPPFHALPNTPSVNGLSDTLLNFNPNESQPFRIGRLDSYTCDQNHKYTEELEARNLGLMNQYVQFGAKGPGDAGQFCHQNENGDFDTDMGYFDGNTVTGLWHYAQYFVLADNFFATMPGESTRGHLNLVAGDVSGALCAPANMKSDKVYVDNGGTVPFCNGPVDSTDNPPPFNPDGTVGTLVDDSDPYYDVCSETDDTVAMSGRNIGDMLSEAGIPWGWFQGGFSDCERSHPKIAYDLAIGVNPRQDTVRLVDYVPHHNPFQFYQSTANPQHLEPFSVREVGHDGRANHQYDLHWFWRAAERGNLPAVSFLKPANYQNGHPGQSEPLDEQVFIVETLNRLQTLPEWRHMAVLIAWDDSDGWYDHVMPPVVNQSATSLDTGSSGQLLCGTETQGAGARCAYGPRIPFLAVSGFSKRNYVSSVLLDQTSILRFIEDNWLGGARVGDATFDQRAGSLSEIFDFEAPRGERSRRLFLDPYTGRPRSGNVW